MVYAYEQCLQTMGFHPNVWCEAALYLDQVSQKLLDKGVSQLTGVTQRGVQAMILATK